VEVEVAVTLALLEAGVRVVEELPMEMLVVLQHRDKGTMVEQHKLVAYIPLAEAEELVRSVFRQLQTHRLVGMVVLD
jgi:hypothetical protein